MSQSDDSRRRRALGRGLGALIGGSSDSESQGRQFVELPVDQIDAAPDQPRSSFDEEGLAELADSIVESGLIQPLVVREKQGRYQLIAGERRLRACRIAGIEKAPAVIKDVSDQDAFALALIENIQRQDLNPVEEALAYRRLLDDDKRSQADVAARVGKSRSSISNSLRLLKLCDPILDHLAAGRISAGHARALIPLADDEAQEVVADIIDEGWSVRRTEEEVRHRQRDQASQRSPTSTRSTFRDDALVRDINERLQHRLKTRVQLKERRDQKGTGKIEIYYDDHDVLQSVLDHLLDE